MSRHMLARFSLYGFLKNQKYFEPFLILAFRDRGLSFLMIGLLIGFRQVWVNVLEVPSGFIADVFGRRRSMIASFAAYILSFIIFAISRPLWTLFFAMFFFAVGEAFRTGTHKAMIFDWLTSRGRSSEKTRYYGYTRSWSEIGSALSVVIATVAVLITHNYTAVFWLSILPYLLNIINFLGYPSWLDGTVPADISFRALRRSFLTALAGAMKNRPLRMLFVESMTFKGNTALAGDYLQPLLKQGALLLPILLAWPDEQRTTILVGAVFFLLYLLSGLASRNAHAFADRLGGELRAAAVLWYIEAAAFVTAAAALLMDSMLIAAAMFVLVVILENIWRPIQMSRIDEVSDAAMGATILSIDSQASSFYVMIFAPLLGWAVDAAGLWPVAVFGVITTIPILFRRFNRGPNAA